MDQILEFLAWRYAETVVWWKQPLTNGALVTFAAIGFGSTILAINRLFGALRAIHRLLYKQVNGDYPRFDLLS